MPSLVWSLQCLPRESFKGFLKQWIQSQIESGHLIAQGMDVMQNCTVHSSKLLNPAAVVMKLDGYLGLLPFMMSEWGCGVGGRWEEGRVWKQRLLCKIRKDCIKNS